MNSVLQKIARKTLPKSFRDFLWNLIYTKEFSEITFVENFFNESNGLQYIMFDVGAHYGTTLRPFAEKKWTIFAFEPDPNNRKILIERNKKYSNINIDIRAVSDVSKQLIPFYTSKISTGISGLSSFHKSHKEAFKIETIRLDDFCSENNISRVDFLKIDVEGYDLMVIKSYGWSQKNHPRIIVAEFENKKTLPLGYSLKDMIDYLESKGYKVLISEWEPIVEYGGSATWKRFTWDYTSIDPSVAWGNIIACKVEDMEKLDNLIR